MCACVVLTVHVPLHRLWVSAHSRDGYPIDFRPYTLMDFVIATERALRPQAYSSLWALAHFLERGVRLDRQVSHVPPGRHT